MPWNSSALGSSNGGSRSYPGWPGWEPYTPRQCLGSLETGRTFGSLQAALAFLRAGWRRHGDDDPQHLSTAAALWVEAAELPGGPDHIGRFLAKHHRLHSPCYKLRSLVFPSGGVCWDVCRRPCVGEPGWQIWQKNCKFSSAPLRFQVASSIPRPDSENFSSVWWLPWPGLCTLGCWVPLPR